MVCLCVDRGVRSFFFRGNRRGSRARGDCEGFSFDCDYFGTAFTNEVKARSQRRAGAKYRRFALMFADVRSTRTVTLRFIGVQGDAGVQRNKGSRC